MSTIDDLNKKYIDIAGVEQTFKTKTGSFCALQNVNLQVAKGEFVTLIGHSGCGKSTLLKILSRITEPTRGVSRTRGRVASLLEVGTGFHSELTGRENIQLAGAIMWFDNTFIGLLTKLGYDVSRALHFYEAWLASLAILAPCALVLLGVLGALALLLLLAWIARYHLVLGAGGLYTGVMLLEHYEGVGRANEYTTAQIVEYGMHLKHVEAWCALMEVKAA